MLEHPVGGEESMICKLDAVAPPELSLAKERNGQLVLGAAARVGHLFQAHIIHGLFQVTVLGLDKRRFVPLRIPKWEIFSSGAIVIERMRDSQWALIMFHIN